MSNPVRSADSPAETLKTSHHNPVANLSPKPHRPIPGTEHIRLPEYIDRQGRETWVRSCTERRFDLRQMQPAGPSATSMVKGLTRAIAFQQALIRAEGWPQQG